MNVSDFAAKGVKPSAMLVSLGLTKTTTENDVREIGKGLNMGGREYGVYVIGGDTGETSDIVISLSMFGLAKKDQITLRSGAKPDDVLAVTGTFGQTAAGLEVLLHGNSEQRKEYPTLVESVLMPHARLGWGLALGKTKALTASIDSSDGLAWSLHEIATASNVGFLIDTIPIAEEAKEFAAKTKVNPLHLALYGGEEYELVLTIKPTLFDKARKAIEKAGGRLWPIGKATANKQVIIKTERKEQIVDPRGYEHFK